MGEFDRTGIVNTIDWLEEDTKCELGKKQNAEFLRMKAQYEKAKWYALSEMYRTIEEAQDKYEDCITAIKMTEFCFGMGFVSEKVCTEICDYLKEKAKKVCTE
jgi:hypothetical protein